MNDPFWSASMRKCRPPGATAFAYFAKVLARFSETNVLACVQATMDYRSPGGQFLGMPKRVFRSALRRVPKSFAHSRGNRTFFPELLRQRHLSRFWSSRKLRHRDCGSPVSPARCNDRAVRNTGNTVGAIGSESQTLGPAEVAGGILRELSDRLGLDKSLEVI
jgi:hypothetical protein